VKPKPKAFRLINPSNKKTKKTPTPKPKKPVIKPLAEPLNP
jgi:small neutral amino acid transporter SnatA (MarC family)